MPKKTDGVTQNSQSQNTQHPVIPHKLSDVKVAVSAVAITNIDPDKMMHEDEKKRTKHKEKYANYHKELEKQIELSGDKIIATPVPFYKNNVTSPAGYVIETQNEVIVAYHGTQFGRGDSGKQEMKHDIELKGAKMDFGGKTTHIHSGFKAEFDLSKDDLQRVLKIVLSKAESQAKGVSFTGHSLGGAVAQIAALDAVQNHNMKVNKITTLGGPRVFKEDAAKLYEEVGLGDKTLRIKNSQDPVPSLPPKAAGYHHAGYKAKITTKAPSALSHPGGQYRKTAMHRITEEDISKARPPAPRSFKKEYLDPLLKMTKQKFAKLIKGVSKPFQSTSQDLQNEQSKLNKSVGQQAQVIAQQNHLQQYTKKPSQISRENKGGTKITVKKSSARKGIRWTR